MRRLTAFPCDSGTARTLAESLPLNEAELESSVVKALSCVYPEYKLVVFGGGFRYEDDLRRPDFALIARNLSHWFVVEVELSKHSLEGHVLPQLRAFRFGEPQGDCVGILARELGISFGQAETFLQRVPRAVVVIAEAWKMEWEHGIRAINCQLLLIRRFAGDHGLEVFEISGSLLVVKESLGFGIYSAIDLAVRFVGDVALGVGQVQIDTIGFGLGLWDVVKDKRFTWLIAIKGTADIRDGATVQLVRSIDGRVSLRT